MRAGVGGKIGRCGGDVDHAGAEQRARENLPDDCLFGERETGEVTGGPPPFAKQDRSRFLDALETAVQKAARARP